MVKEAKQIRNIWMISREYGELAGAGGVKDVVYQLSRSLARWTGRSVHVVLPGYGFIDSQKAGFIPLLDPLLPTQQLKLDINMELPDRSVKEEVRYYYKKEERVSLYLVEAERYSEKKDVYTYSEEEEKASTWKKKSHGHHDYFAMNVLLQKAAVELIIALDEHPDVIHCHDGHTAILAALIREHSGYSGYFRATGCLVTLHNAGYGYHQEVADIPYALSITGLPRQVIDKNQLEHKFDPLLVAGEYAILNTVSENYARELQETDNDRLTGWLGHELKARGVVIEGVTNGIDPVYYGPQKDGSRERRYYFDPADKTDTLAGKQKSRDDLALLLKNKAFLRGVEVCGYLEKGNDMTLFTFVGRLSEQKGVDTLVEVLPTLLGEDGRAQMLIMGNGSQEFESELIDLAETSETSGRMCFLKGYSPELANQVYAAGDFLIIPSRYEPCGLTDFIAQLFGNIPVVHHVGGLVKVVDGKTGIAYRGNDPEDLLAALHRALALEKTARRKMQKLAVETIKGKYTWNHVMRKYIDLYKRCHEKQLSV